MILISKLFWIFLKIGFFSFGGGYAMIPFMQKEIIENNGFISLHEFLDIIGVSQMTPGPISINAATFVGYRVSKITGALFATLGIGLSAFILVSIVYKIMDKFKENDRVKYSLKMMRPILVALIIKAFLDLANVAYGSVQDILITLLVAYLIFKKKINPILVIIISGVLGIIIYR